MGIIHIRRSFMSPHEHGIKAGKSEGLLLAVVALIEQFTKELGTKVVANSLSWAIRRTEMKEQVLEELDAQHFFQDIWLEEPVKVISYYSYEKKYIRGEDHRVLKFDHDEEKRFLPLRRKLEELYRKDNPGHYTDNKVVYVYELKNGRQVAVMFKDGRTVFGNTWDVQDY
jgi:oligoribonuclease NrnB/cAMP/cGMP phosphodiesterase (DHH superfamily)